MRENNLFNKRLQGDWIKISYIARTRWARAAYRHSQILEGHELHLFRFLENIFYDRQTTKKSLSVHLYPVDVIHTKIGESQRIQ